MNEPVNSSEPQLERLQNNLNTVLTEVRETQRCVQELRQERRFDTEALQREARHNHSFAFWAVIATCVYIIFVYVSGCSVLKDQIEMTQDQILRGM